MMIDLGAELIAALRSEAGRTALVDAIAGPVAEVLERVLVDRDRDRLLDRRALAALIGITPAALRQRLRRGSDLAQLATILDGKQMWRRSDVEGLLHPASALRRGAGG
jgi:hypothetical protein